MNTGAKLFFVVMISSFLLLSCSPNSRAVLPDDEESLTGLDLAWRGVSANDEWEPWIREINGFQMALVPSGCFMMGSDNNANETPIHEVCITRPFWVDVTEVSNAQFENIGGEAEQDSYVVTPDHPRENITHQEAITFCEMRNGKLPTEAEWEYIGRGPDALIYPWGNEFDGSKLNICDENCGDPVNRSPDVNDGYAKTAPVDAFPEGTSWVGALGLAGNVHEMVSDWYAPNYYSESPLEDPGGPEGGQQYTARGGCWGCSAEGSILSTRHRRLDPNIGAEFTSIVTGFRCVISISKN